MFTWRCKQRAMSAALGLGFFCGAVTALTRPHAQQSKTYLGLGLTSFRIKCNMNSFGEVMDRNTLRLFSSVYSPLLGTEEIKINSAVTPFP